MAHASPAVVMLGFFLLFMTTMEVVFVVVQGAGVFQLVAQIQCTTTFDQQQRNRQQVSVRVGALNADVIFTVSRNARGDRGDQQTLWGPVVNPDVLTDYCNLLLPAGTYTATLVKDAAGVPTLFYVTDHSKGEEVVRLSLTSQVVAQIQCMTSVQQHNRVSVWVGPLRANIIFTAASHATDPFGGQTLWGPVVNAHVFAADRKNVGGTPAEYRATLSKNAAGVPVLFHVTDSRRGETMLRLSVNWKR